MIFPFHDDTPTSRFPLVTCAIIGLNLASLLYLNMLPDLDRRIVIIERAFVPKRVEQLFDPNLVVKVPIVEAQPRLPPGWPPQVPPPQLVVPAHPLQPVRSEVLATFVTSLFLHGGWLHLIGNMWFLWLFGNNIEDRLGHVLYIVLYVAGGVVAALCHWAMIPEKAMLQPVIGASGAVAAILGAYAVTYPRANIRCVIWILIFFTIVELPALLVLGFWFASQLIDALADSHRLTGGVAWWAHVGGFLAGMALMPILRVIRPADDPAADPEHGW